MDPHPSTTRTSRAWVRLLLFAFLALVGFFAAIVLSGNLQMVGAGVASLATIAWAMSLATVRRGTERPPRRWVGRGPRPRRSGV